MCFCFKVDIHVLLNTAIYSNCEKGGCLWYGFNRVDICLDCHVMLMKYKVVYRVDTTVFRVNF